ncbi:MAG: alpha-L-rhamnosidase N-terminal domain-containing protein, partial [Tannerella sp.]|nr:alpha-L-rhamnosidase N-terminal domain-containing protein [Tannerella sp.]
YAGNWIWQHESKPNTWVSFRKTIDLKTVPSEMKALIATDSKYWLWINGRLVVREGGLKRTPNPNDTYADTLDISPFMKNGKNLLAVLVWYWGKEGHGHNGSGHGGLYFEARSGRQQIITDESWKVKQHTAFDTLLRGTQPYRPLAEFNVVYDAREEMEGWYQEDFDDSSWRNAVCYGKPPQGLWGNLVIRPIPQWKDYGLKDYLNKFPASSMGNILTMQLPYNSQITPYFKIKARAGQRVDIRTDCYTDGGAYNVRAEYVTKDGIQEFECPGWMSGEQVWYCFSPEIEIISLKYRESGYDTEFTGSFECSDAFYNTLWEKARRTLYVNMRDNFMDCPTRERAMWWGDVVVSSVQSYYAFSPDVYLLTQKAITELVNWQTGEGVLYSPIPGPHPPLIFGPYRELPLQSLAAVSKLSLGYYYLFSGDTATLVRAYPAIKKYLSLWEMGDDGLVVHRDGKWNWQDWGTDIDVPLLDNAWYYSALDMAKQMAVLSNKPADTIPYVQRMESIRDNFNRLFWTGTEYRSPSYTKATDDRGNAMAVVTGIAGEDKWDKIRLVLNKEQHASPYMEKFVLEALLKTGAAQDALVRMKNRYAEMVESKVSTLPESWYFNSFSQSRNHGWSGGPLSLLMQYVVGIVPLKPEYEEFLISPQTGNLEFVNAVIPAPTGNIEINISNKEEYTIEVKVPDKTKALVRLPESQTRRRKIYLDKKEIQKLPDFLAPGFYRLTIDKSGQHKADPDRFISSGPDFPEMMQPVPVKAKFADEQYFIWGASMIRDDKGIFHIYYSRWEKKYGFQSWVTHSEIAHATAPDPFGPFTHKDVVLPARGKDYWDGMSTHNPTMHKFGNTYYLYYTGNTGDGICTETLNFTHRNNQRIGVAVASNPDGPWMRFDKPLIDVSPDSLSHDALMVSNPSVTMRPDSTFLLIYKAVGKKNKPPFGGPVVHLTATSGSPAGPFIKQQIPVFTFKDAPFPAEDPYIWYQDDKYYAIVKDMKGYFTNAGRSLALFESDDGFSWKQSDHVLVSDLTVNWEDGVKQQMSHLERPQIYFEDGKPKILLVAADILENGVINESYNIQIPLVFPELARQKSVFENRN